VTPANLAAMAGQCEQLADLEAKIENRRDDMQRRQREFAIVSQRIVTLAEECGCLGSSDSEPPVAGRAGGSPKARPQPPEKAAPLDLLDYLRAEYERHSQRVEQRKEIRKRGKALRIESVKHGHSALGHRRRREALFSNMRRC